MIKLDQSAIDRHPLMSQLKSPPSHAKLIAVRHARAFDRNSLPPGASIQPNLIDGVYAFGTLDDDGEFVASTIVPSMLIAVGTASSEVVPNQTFSVSFDGIDPQLKASAIGNLVGAGVAPTPGSPDVPLPVPAKKADTFKDCDLDAYVAFFDQRLKGDVA